MTNLAPSSTTVSRAYHEELSPGQRSALLSWLAFTATFAGLRALTYSIRAGKGPFRNISIGGEHLHHYLWGIGLLSGVGAVAVRGEEQHRRHPAVAVSYGAGLALIVDEFALLLDLKDVYWARQGRISIDIGVGGIAVAGSYFAALPVLRRLQRERKQKALAPKAPAPKAVPEPQGRLQRRLTRPARRNGRTARSALVSAQRAHSRLIGTRVGCPASRTVHAHAKQFLPSRRLWAGGNYGLPNGTRAFYKGCRVKVAHRQARGCDCARHRRRPAARVPVTQHDGKGRTMGQTTRRNGSRGTWLGMRAARLAAVAALAGGGLLAADSAPP